MLFMVLRGKLCKTRHLLRVSCRHCVIPKKKKKDARIWMTGYESTVAAGFNVYQLCYVRAGKSLSAVKVKKKLE